MRILHVISTLDPAAGGPPLVVVRIAAAQAAQGHAVTVFAYSSTKAKDRMERSISKVPSIHKVSIELFPTSGAVESILGLMARRRLKELIGSADWVHCHGVWERIIQIAAGVAFASGVPYCVRPAGMLDPWSLRQKRIKKRLAMALGYRRMLSRAAFIHALNADESRLIEPLQLNTSVEIIPNGVFPEEISPLPDKGSFRKFAPELGAASYILFMARLHVKKGLDYLIEAFEQVAERLDDVKLVIAGPDDGAEAWVRERCKSSRYSCRILIVGPLYGEDKFSALVDSAVFCLPSRQEGFSIAALEALACGVPLVISKPSNFPEVEEAGAGVVVELDAYEIAAGLLRILGNDSVRNKMSVAASALVRERYLWPRIAALLIGHYEQYSAQKRV